MIFKIDDRVQLSATNGMGRKGTVMYVYDEAELLNGKPIINQGDVKVLFDGDQSAVVKMPSELKLVN